MHELVLAAGVDAEKVFTDSDRGRHRAVSARRRRAASRGARRRSAFPSLRSSSARFSRTASGWAKGSSRSSSKGPTRSSPCSSGCASAIPELFVLLTGPARGYVRRELERLGIPYRHVVLDSRDELASAYHALDVCLVTSRQEGGPKAVLESMAAGVPLVTTRVGQAPELVVDGENGLLADVDDVDALAAAVARVHDDAALARRCAPPVGRRPRPMPRSGSTLAGRSCSTGSSRGAACGLTARASGATRGPARRWARLLRRRGRAGRSARVLRPRPSCPRRGSRVAGGTAKFQRLAARFPNQSDRLHAALSRLDVAAARSRRAAAARRGGAVSGRRQPGRRRLSGLGRRGDGSS